MEPAGRGRVERRLAAILAADIAGYSRLIEADEEGTLGRLRALRAEVIDPEIGGHRGRIVKTTGDGLLVEFISVVDALKCAAEMQAALAEGNAALPPDRRIEFRIGINVGDIVVEDGDIFGDGVNIAARLEGLAEPGGICVSARVQEDAAGRLDLAFEDMGDQALKNIARPVRAYRVVTAAGSASMRANAGPALPDKPSIAVTPLPAPRLSIIVLPFANLSNDPEQEYFADGITDDLTTDLSRISGSFVIARSTAFTYKGQAIDIKQIGRDLGVRYVLEGSIRRTGELVQANVQLLDAESGAHVWAERFDTDRRNLSAAQREITARLAQTLNLELIKDVGRRIEAEKPADPDARDLVMRGWYWYHRPRSAAATAEAERAFERALAIEPRLVEAQVGLARVLTVRLVGNFESRSLGAVQGDSDRAEQLLLEAIESDPNHSAARSTMGQLRRVQNRLAEARIELETAIAVGANDHFTHSQHAWTLLLLGEPEAAVTEGEKAIRASPRDPTLWGAYLVLGWCRLLLAEVDPAIELLIKSRAANPRPWVTHLGLAGALGLKGEIAGAKAAIAESLRLNAEVRSLARFRDYRPWGNPRYWALFEKTAAAGLRRAGFPGE
jgi:adenylate cyclase